MKMVRTVAMKLVGGSSKKLRRERDIPAGIAVVQKMISYQKYRPPTNRVMKRKIPRWQRKITDFFDRALRTDKENNNCSSTVETANISEDDAHSGEEN